MKIALAHDWLSLRFGGAEQVLSELARIYPDAPIYTLAYDPKVVGDRLDPARIRTSTIQRRPGWLRSRPRYLLPLIPSAVEGLDFSEFDLVISSSGAWMKNILTPTETRHLCYSHSPMRFAWDYWPRYLDEQSVGPVRRSLVRALTSYLRVWDRTGVTRVDRYLANSETVQGRLDKYYCVPSRVLYPPVEITDLKPSQERSDFLLCVGALTPYKRFDLAIEAARLLGRRLIISGDGPDRGRLEKLAQGAQVEFLGFVPRSELAHLYGTAAALIHPQVEDFGITVVEALATGTPVVAYRAGGATETLTEEYGVFFDAETPEALAEAIRTLEGRTFDPAAMRRHAERFSREAFEAGIREEVERLVRR